MGGEKGRNAHVDLEVLSGRDVLRHVKRMLVEQTGSDVLLDSLEDDQELSRRVAALLIAKLGSEIQNPEIIPVTMDPSIIDPYRSSPLQEEAPRLLYFEIPSMTYAEVLQKLRQNKGYLTNRSVDGGPTPDEVSESEGIKGLMMAGARFRVRMAQCSSWVTYNEVGRFFGMDIIVKYTERDIVKEPDPSPRTGAFFYFLSILSSVPEYSLVLINGGVGVIQNDRHFFGAFEPCWWHAGHAVYCPSAKGFPAGTHFLSLSQL